MDTRESPVYHDLVVGNVVTDMGTGAVYVVAHIIGDTAALVPREGWQDIWTRSHRWFWIPRRLPRVEDPHG